MAYVLEHRTNRVVGSGLAYPLGATPGPTGVNFALYSKHATEVFLLLFDAADGEPTDVIRLDQRTRYVWHAFVHGVRPGQLYGYKVRGPYRSGAGPALQRAQAAARSVRARRSRQAAQPRQPAARPTTRAPRAIPTSHSTRATTRPWCRSASSSTITFDWQGDTPPDVPFEKLVIYEVHVEGLHRASVVARRASRHLPRLHREDSASRASSASTPSSSCRSTSSYVDDFLIGRGLTNYWGYNTLGFFAPTSLLRHRADTRLRGRRVQDAGPRAASRRHRGHPRRRLQPHRRGQRARPDALVSRHRQPDVLRAHRPAAEPGRYYMNWTGCGNSLDFDDRDVIRFVMDSLRYWVEQMHVDGFRFDLASVLGRAGPGGGFQPRPSFFDAVAQDPVLQRVKLIAEPWDLGTYQVGNFPVDWSEWNGRFRDTIRRFTKGDTGQLRRPRLAPHGLGDLYGDDGRSPYNSINFVTCHDGFTLCDLVAYDHKHNERNLEDNRDGSDDNNSWNCGVEGPTDDPDVLALRRQLAKNSRLRAAARLGHADAARRRRVPAHAAAATTTPTARTTRSAGSTGTRRRGTPTSWTSGARRSSSRAAFPCCSDGRSRSRPTCTTTVCPRSPGSAPTSTLHAGTIPTPARSACGWTAPARRPTRGTTCSS